MTFEKKIYVRRACLEDLPRILEIFAIAKQILKESNSPQWQNGLPNQNTFKQDILKKECFVLIVNQEIAGMATIQLGPDPNYHKIYKGSWQEDVAYRVIHRVAIDRKYQGMHLNELFFSNLLTLCAQDTNRIRIDTHPLNYRMQHILAKFNFSYCGIIEVDDPADPQRKAYELLLN